MTDKVREALEGIPHGAIDALANNQRQLDVDGCEVGVSRQAVDEVLAGLRAALAALDADTEVKVEKTYCAMLSTGVCDMPTKLESSEAKLAEARKVIEPFARAEAGFPPMLNDDGFAYSGSTIKIRDLRAARRWQEGK